MAQTTIEWTQRTLNFWVGCSIVSSGCSSCYAMKMAKRLEAMGVPAYAGTTMTTKAGPVWTGRLNRGSPARWREPATVAAPSLFFVNSMSDFFHPDVPDEWRAEALDVMRATPRHEYQVLTKRPALVEEMLARIEQILPPNVWLGTSIENAMVKHRIDELRQVEASLRWLSIEPLIGSVGELDLSGIGWIVAGAESGPRARLMDEAWVREVRDQCIAQDVRFFYKQAATPAGKKLSLPLLDDRQWMEWPRRPDAIRAA